MLKKISATIIIAFMVSSTFAQANFPINWESKFENDGDYLRYGTENGKYVIGTTKKEVSVLDGTNGKPIWKKTFSELAGVKEAKSQQIIEETETLLFISRQKGNDELFCVDLKTGKKLWGNNQFNDIDLNSLLFIKEAGSYVVLQKNGLTFIDEKTGVAKGSVEGIKGVIGRYGYIQSSNQLVLFAYQVNSLKAIGSGFKNNLVCIDLNTKKIKWNTIVKGMVEIKKFPGKNFSQFDWASVGINQGKGSSSIVVDLFIKENKIFLFNDGLQAFDLANGNKLWELEFDLSLNRGMGGSSQLYNAVAAPLFTNEHIYIASFEKGRDKSIKKYEIESGKLLWETPVDGRKVIIPTLSLIDGILVAQIGGYVNLQGEDKNETFSKWKWQGPYGLKGFDAATGKLKWETEKFDDRITNVLINNNTLLVADESSLYAINILTGDKLFTTKLKDAKTGKAQYIFNSGDRLMMLGEDGIAAYNSKGNYKYSLTAKDASMNTSNEYGESLFYMGTDDEMIAVDLLSGKEIGRFDYKKGYKYSITNSGNTFIVYKDEKVSNYKVK